MWIKSRPEGGPRTTIEMFPTKHLTTGRPWERLKKIWKALMVQQTHSSEPSPARGEPLVSLPENFRRQWMPRLLGFTVVEVILATAILAVGLLGMIGVFSVSSVDLAKSAGTLRSIGLAQQRIEELRNMTTSALVALNTQTTTPPTLPADASTDVTVDGRTYTVRTWLSVTNVQTTPTLLRRIDATVVVSTTDLTGTQGYRLDNVIGEK
jgi:Tfp pilus assembly protein PilV